MPGGHPSWRPDRSFCPGGHPLARNLAGLGSHLPGEPATPHWQDPTGRGQDLPHRQSVWRPHGGGTQSPVGSSPGHHAVRDRSYAEQTKGRLFVCYLLLNIPLHAARWAMAAVGFSKVCPFPRPGPERNGHSGAAPSPSPHDLQKKSTQKEENTKTEEKKGQSPSAPYSPTFISPT